MLIKHPILLLLICLSLPIQAFACDTVVGRKIIDQLLNNQPTYAQKLLSHQLKRNPTDPMNGFFQGAIQWARSGEGSNKSLAKKALSTLQKSFTHSQKALRTTPNNTLHRLNSGMSQMLVARIYAGRKQWLAAYKNGKQARLDLQKLSLNNPHEKDVLIGLGLFEFYTGSVPRNLRWLTKLMSFTGNKEKGVELIHKAIKESPIFAPEAGRVVVNEIIYSRSDNLCQYLDLSRYLRLHYPNNPQFSFAYQKVFNNCGYAPQALNDNLRAQKQFAKYPGVVKRLKLQKLYIQSHLEKAKDINEFQGKSLKETYHQNIALGMVYDIRGEREKAIKSYSDAKIIAGKKKGLNKKIKFLNTPYKKPSPQPITANYPVANGCG